MRGLAQCTAAQQAQRSALVCDGFEQSGEFLTLVSTLHGTSTGDNERVEHYIRNLYLGALGREPNATELQQHTQELNTAAAQGQSQVVAQAEQIGRAVFAAQVANPSMNTHTEFVTNLYEAFLQRGPDAGGLAHWPVQAANNRQSVLNYFATYPVTRELAATLYREVNWLVSDQLGTPRMVVDKSGSLAGVKRHDYLPFGEELFAGVGGRTTGQGYSVADGVRQKFTSKERDDETGLDYFLARYYSSTQGRFTSPDEFTGGPDELYYFVDDASANPTFYADIRNPQSLNKYQYAYNNPLRYIDPDGHEPDDPDPDCCQESQDERRARRATAGATTGAVVGTVVGAGSGGVAGGAAGTLVAPGVGTVAGAGGGGIVGAAKGAAIGAGVGAVIAVVAGEIYDYATGANSPPPLVPAPAQPQTETPPQPQAQPQTTTPAQMSPRPIDKPRKQGHRKGKKHNKHTRKTPGESQPPGFKPRVPKRPQDMEPKPPKKPKRSDDN